MDKEQLLAMLPEVEKPARYLGNEWNSVHKDHGQVSLKIALAFPDTYEVGMSHIGLKILYHLLNRHDHWAAERVYAPWLDMEVKMREQGIPLYALESLRPLSEFDLVGFTLQYEMSYSNILNMLDLAGIPLLQRDRSDKDPLIIAGGPCAYNPEPLADFMDFFFIGEAEEVIEPIMAMVETARRGGWTRHDTLVQLAKMPGVYVPSLYAVSYREDGVVAAVKPVEPGVPEAVEKQVVQDLDQAFFPDKFIVPFLEAVHERVVLEIARGCTRGCRFCQAGMIYRPVRERSLKTLKEQARKLIDSTGYEEISLGSLSTSDYTGIKRLAGELVSEYQELGVGIALPSLRIDSFSVGLAKEVQRVRKSGLTFAPEAGSQRMRDVINKGVTEENLLEAASAAVEEGWSSIKLYFMLGLPTEQDEDLFGIAELAKKVSRECDQIRRRNGTKAVNITVSVSNFVPKPHTPFQWQSMDTIEEIRRKQDLLKQEVRGKGLKLNWHGPELSIMEGIFARGDRRLGAVLYTAWQKGAKMDGWSESFSFDNWMEAFRECGVDPMFYLNFPYEKGDRLPWQHIHTGVSEGFLWNEYQRALSGEHTVDCRFEYCSQCDCCDNLNVAIKLLGAES